MITNSKTMRESSLFMRNQFEKSGKFEIPQMKKQKIDLKDLKLISYSDTYSNDNKENQQKGVHFFIDDYKFNNIYTNPEKSFKKLSQYKFLLTPDYSLYSDMDIWKQIENTGKNRWLGCFWQEKGLKVIPTVSWSTPSSFEFCFDGIKRGSIVAIGMIGCKKNKSAFMLGYNEMLKRIKPEAIICFGSPFSEMKGKIIPIDYLSSRRVNRYGR